MTEQEVREGKGDVPNERIRLFWFDIRPVWLRELTEWLKEEWGACIVMDMLGYTPYTLIDTSSEQSLMKGLAKRYLCDVPMIRQVHGTADNYVNDIARVVKECRIDCVIWPAPLEAFRTFLWEQAADSGTAAGCLSFTVITHAFLVSTFLLRFTLQDKT